MEPVKEVFLAADKRHYKRLCPSFGRSVGWSVEVIELRKCEDAHFRPCPPVRDWYWPCIQPCFSLFERTPNNSLLKKRLCLLCLHERFWWSVRHRMKWSPSPAPHKPTKRNISPIKPALSSNDMYQMIVSDTFAEVMRCFKYKILDTFGLDITKK